MRGKLERELHIFANLHTTLRDLLEDDGSGSGKTVVSFEANSVEDII